MTDDESTPEAPSLGERRRDRRRATLALTALLLALVGAATWFVVFGVAGRDSGSASEPSAPANEAIDRLSPRARAPRPIPAGAVEVLVVERDGGAAVAGVDVALRRDLGDGDAEAVTGTTRDDGLVLLQGEFPAFIELRSERWTTDPLRVPVDERTRVRVEVGPRVPFVIHLLDEATGLPVVGWLVGGVDAVADDAARADGSGIATLSRRARAPEILAAVDGRRHVRAFLLAAIPGRFDVRLEVPAPTRTTTIRCVDDAGRAIPGAVVAVGSASSGVSLPCDDRGEATVEYGARAAVPLVVSAPGRFPRAVRVDGAASVTVVLAATSTRRFRFRTANGTAVEDGQRLRGFTRGPLSYGVDGAGREFVGRSAGGLADVPDLPAGPFEATVWVEGPGVSTIARIAGGDDPSPPIDVVVGPPRRFTLTGIPSAGGALSSTAVVRVDGVRACATDVGAEARDVAETFARGRPVDALGACFVVRGPDAEVSLPRSTEPRRVEVLATGGALACLVVEPADEGGARPLAFSTSGEPPTAVPVALRVEWAEGGAAELLSIDVRRDERLGESQAALTDSTGTASVRLVPGRYVVEATGSDGTRFSGEGPVLVPVAGPVVVRLRALAR